MRNEQVENEIRRKIAFTTASKRIKLRNIFNKNVTRLAH
jgi:hypothetical protein